MLVSVIFAASEGYCPTAVNGPYADGHNLLGRDAVRWK